MSALSALTKIAVVGGIGVLAYSAFTGGLPFKKAPVPIEQGYVNPKNVKIHSSVNDKGNMEAYLNYESGDTRLSLPIYSGPKGPLVGNAEYYWSSITTEAKSGLVKGSWSELLVDTRKSILKGEIEKMIENYGKGEGK